MTAERRREVVSNLGYCFNCLARSHTLNSCTSMEACKRCDQLHHTMLHLPSRQSRQRDESVGGRTASSRAISRSRSPSRTSVRRARSRAPSRNGSANRAIVRAQQQRPQQQQRRQQQLRRRQQQRQQPHRQQQQRRRNEQQQQNHQPRQPQQLAAQSAGRPEPRLDGRLLTEAIKSLANVLCVTYSAQSTG